jgi:hypothetical protein
MLNRDPAREAPRPPRRSRFRSIAEPSLRDDGLARFRRAYRWLNLTLIQQGIWPLLVVVFGAPVASVGLTPLPWYWARVAGPALAALLALAFLRQFPDRAGEGEREVTASSPLRQQAALVIVGVTLLVALLRLFQGPFVPVAKLELFGLADVAAYQAINFGVVARGLAGRGAPLWPVALFALSWGLHDLALAGVSADEVDLTLAFGVGATVGLLVGGASWALRRWPGGSLTASAMHYLVVYLVLGYLP